MIIKSKCAAECEGIVEEVKSLGGDNPWRARARYTVDGVQYELHEALAVKMTAIKLGPIPIGQKKAPVMGNVQAGDTVRVAYDPAKPERAYLTDNKGIVNC